jgi:homoserine kinase
MLDETREIVVPGSISNLGPAFDALSVAVDLYLRVRVVERDAGAPDTLVTEFVGPPPAGENRVEVAFRAARERCGVATPGLRIQVCSEIPVRAGLGSSAAATVAGIRLYEAEASGAAGIDALAIAAAIEGHPDNAAAAVLGGLTVSCQHDDGRVTARSSRWPSELRFVVATPDLGVETSNARAVLPPTIGLRDAVFNLQRALLLMSALESGDHEHLREALRDRWHQPARAALVPGLADALAIDDPAVLGVCLCGSGPSIVALVTDGVARATELFEEVYRRIGVPCTLRTLRAHQSYECL